jgi:hypothetical protein
LLVTALLITGLLITGLLIAALLCRSGAHMTSVSWRSVGKVPMRYSTVFSRLGT